MRSFVGAADYYELNMYFSSDFGASVYDGVFYIKTSNNTYYWAKPTSGNFIFDKTTYNNVMNVKGASYNYSSTIDQAVATQRAGIEYYNPFGCQ